MKNWPHRSSRPRDKRGLTLVEVVLGLALLGALLVSILVTRSRVARQSYLAQRRQDAVRAADRLLNQWWAEPAKFPRTAAGALADAPALAWRTQTVANDDARSLGGAVVRLDVLDRSQQADASGVILSVEVLLPWEDQPE